MQRAVEGGAGKSDSQVCAVGIRMHPQSRRRGRAVSRYRVSMASWYDSGNYVPCPSSVKLRPVHRTAMESPRTESKWHPKADKRRIIRLPTLYRLTLSHPRSK